MRLFEQRKLIIEFLFVKMITFSYSVHYSQFNVVNFIVLLHEISVLEFFSCKLKCEKFLKLFNLFDGSKIRSVFKNFQAVCSTELDLS